MPCTANCHCALGSRTWLWHWTRGSEPISGWVDTRDVVFVDSDGEEEAEQDNRPCALKVAGCLCSTIGNFIGSVIVVYLLWLIFFRPYRVRPHVDAAALAAFDLAPGPAPGRALRIRYDLALNVTFFNDHRIYGIRFDHLTAGLYYNGTRVGPPDDTLPSFHQRPRRHRTVYPRLRGQATHVVADAVADQFAADQAQGRFTVDVRVKTTLTYRFWPHRATYYYEYDCWLQFTPPGNGTPAVTGGVKCGVHK